MVTRKEQSHLCLDPITVWPNVLTIFFKGHIRLRRGMREEMGVFPDFQVKPGVDRGC
jgi:hypothetical protein